MIVLALATLTSLELIHENRRYYILVGELTIATTLHLSGTFRIPARTTAILLIFTCFAILAIAVTVHISEPSPRVLGGHPIEQLIQMSRKRFSEVLARQSRTLEDAVREYETRTGMRPPPKFDVWFDFAQANNVVMIDEYDTIHDMIKPFWGMAPATIRKYARDVVGAEDSPYTVFFIRSGWVQRFIYGGWFADPLDEMLRVFARHLPDMDLVFNYYDEPSVVIPHDILEKLIDVPPKFPLNPQNSFSTRPSDLVDDIPNHYGTPVIRIGQNTVWSQLVQSCPVDSPVRNISGGNDDVSSYAYSTLGFIYNTTASTDACNQPSLPMHHGFFDRPDTMNLCPILAPVFSVAKRVMLDEDRDMDWEMKKSQLHWRGTSTGGYAVGEGWRRHHRQRLVSAFDNIKDPVPVLKEVDGAWVDDFLSPLDAQVLFDVKFSTVSGSGTEESRGAQESEFDISPREDQQEVWKWKFLLDVDGHGLSGRFYAMLKSKSLIFKCTMFREWHDEWLWPWVHYIPLSLHGREWYEVVRYFAHENSGQKEAQRIANDSRAWSMSVLRKEDMQAWTFRLLLEYLSHMIFS